MGQQERIGQTMGNAVFPTQRIGQGMNGSDTAIRQPETGIQAAEQHLLSGL